MNRLKNEAEAETGGSLRPGQTMTGSDAELVLAARRGDKRAFVEIVARYQATVCGITLGILSDFSASEDAGQEAFLTAWRKIHELREPASLRAWLSQIARNAALGHLRRKRKHESLERATDLADQLPGPDEVVAKEEEACLVRESLAKLPETYRLPLTLYYRERQSTRAVAEALGISEEAVRQRLARGREMLRERMSGLIEDVLTRTGPTTIFTMTIAAAIGALAAPAAVAGTVFSASAAATTTSTAASSTSFLTTMSTTKALFITAAVVTAICVPVGYHVRSGNESSVGRDGTQIESRATAAQQTPPPSFENSAIFAEWKRLHDTYGTTAEAMPELYQAIANLRDPFRRRAFRAALIAEWVQVDPTNGLAFFLNVRGDTTQRRQFFSEWLARDARAAVDALMASGSGWERAAKEALSDIARRVPARIAEIAPLLPKPDNEWDTRVRDAFAIVAESSLQSALKAAEAMTGPNRDQALAGVAKTWAKSDLSVAIAWAKALPDGVDRDQIIRTALIGRAAVDPVSALELVGSVPPGGRQDHFASTTGARILDVAANADFEATVAWLAAHPSRIGRDDIVGIAWAVADRLNADAAGFLTHHAGNGSLVAILPAIESALLNEGSGQRAAAWEWLKTQPDDETSRHLRQRVLNSAASQDPDLALRLIADLPHTPDGDAQIQTLTHGLLNAGTKLDRFDKLLEQAPERLRQPLVETAFSYLRGESLGDPQQWVARLPLLPEKVRARGTESLARAWAEQAPEEAASWLASLTAGKTRHGAAAAITSTWAAKDAQGASEWVASLPPGIERDHSVRSLVITIAAAFPQEAWTWALSINDPSHRDVAVWRAISSMAARDLATARQWIETGPFTPERKAQLEAAIVSPRPPPGSTRLDFAPPPGAARLISPGLPAQTR